MCSFARAPRVHRLCRRVCSDKPVLKRITNGERGAPGMLRHLRVPFDSPAELPAELPDKRRIVRPCDSKAIDLALPLDPTWSVFHGSDVLMLRITEMNPPQAATLRDGMRWLSSWGLGLRECYKRAIHVVPPASLILAEAASHTDDYSNGTSAVQRASLSRSTKVKCTTRAPISTW